MFPVFGVWTWRFRGYGLGFRVSVADLKVLGLVVLVDLSLAAQRLQYPLVKAYTLNHTRDPTNLRYIP